MSDDHRNLPIVSRWRNLRRYSFDRGITVRLFLLLTIIGVARGLQHYYVVDHFEPIQFGLWWHVPFNLFLWWSWLLIVPLVYWIVVHINPGVAKFLSSLFLLFILPLAIVVFRQSLASTIIWMVLSGYRDFAPLLTMRLTGNVWLWLDFIVYFLVLTGVKVVEYRKRGKNAKVKAAQLETRIAESELNALESLLQPHFLFNTLNTVSTLILKSDATEAIRMLTLLEGFLKSTLSETSGNEITLCEELRSINQYLEIEKVRYKDKLEIRQNVSEDSLTALVPRFLLQPIVENAIRHGIAHRTSSGLLLISATKERSILAIQVEDNGPGMNSPTTKKSQDGVGLKITKDRLFHLYGERHLLDLRRSSAGGLRVVIEIPYAVAPG